jgi:hypothetical protein
MAYRIAKMSSIANVPVEVTEISFWTAENPSTWEPTMTDEAAQAEAFEKMLKTYFSHPAVTSSLLWGFGECWACGAGAWLEVTPVRHGVVEVARCTRSGKIYQQ